jgi:ADP-heptose:LPS heptosyltransferase/GT2 family glycosyltransferase
MARNLMEDVGLAGDALALDRKLLLAVDAPEQGATFSVGSRVVGFGWALAATPIAEVAVLLDGQFVCHATRAIPRPDLVHAYPQFPDAGHSGFVFEFVLEASPSEQAALQFRMLTTDGYQRELSVPIRVQPAYPAEPDSIKLCVDVPEIKGDGCVVPVQDSLIVQGWALARAGIASVSVSVDDVDLGSAYYGIRREDVAAAFPDWPGALLCGYGMSIPLKALRPGRRHVRIRATDGSLARCCEFQIHVNSTSEPAPHEAPRKIMSLAEIRLGRAILRASDCWPRFELLLPVSADEKLTEPIRATLASLAAQEYEHYHLTACGTCDRDALLRDLELETAHVSFVESPHELGPVVQSLAAQGVTFVGFLQPGDLLGCDALLEIALASALDGEADFIYCDERCFDPASATVKPYFKPDWSPDLLLSTNYIGRSWFAHAALLKAWQPGAAGPGVAGDYELVLSLTQVARRVTHVPKLLYQSAAMAIEEVPDDSIALRNMMRARGISGEVLPGCVPGVYRLRRALTHPGRVSIIIPTCGSRDLVKTCIEGIRHKTAYKNFEIVCVDNTPPERADLRSWLQQQVDRLVPTSESFNWSRFNNLGASHAAADSDYLLFLNDDVEVIDPEWLEAMLEHAQRPEVGVVGPLLLYPDGSIQHAALFMLELGHARHAFRFARGDEPGPFGICLSQRNVLAVTGACMLMRRATFSELGGFDEAHAIVNNDLDFCMRSLAHERLVIFTPHARLIHHEMGSRSSSNDRYDVTHFERAWRNIFGSGDPYYNPRLTRESCDFSADPEPLATVFGRGGALGDSTQVRSVLALKLDHIGDFITAFPALRRIKSHFPNSRLSVLASSASARLAHLEPSIDEVIELNFFNERSDLGRLTLSEQDLERLRAQLARYRFDIAIDLRKHLETRDLLRYAGAQLTAGYEREGRFPWLDVAIEWEGDAPLFPKRHHVAEDLLRLVDAVAARVAGEQLSISTGATAAADLECRFSFPSQVLFSRPVICIHPASGNALRQWPVGHFARLIHLLLAEYAVNVAIIGVPGERETTQQLLHQIGSHERVFSLVGLLRLAELPGFLRRCVLFVGNNSGPQHIAAGVGIPTIGLHSGVVDATEWAPVGPAAVALRREMACSPCYFALPEQCQRGAACLRGLRPEQVLQTCRQLLLLNGLHGTRLNGAACTS